MTLDLPSFCGHGKVAGTKRELKAVGVSVLTTTNEWEVLRFKSKFGVGVVYRNKKDKFTANPAAEAALGHIAAGLSSPIAPKLKKARVPKDRPATPPRPQVTIFADASFCNQTGAGGWGAWVVSQAKASRTAGGALKLRFATSAEAEAAALANALAFARALDFLFPGAVVMLQSDCQGMLTQVRRRVAGTMDSPVGKAGDYSEGSTVGIARRGPRGMAPAIEAIWRIATDLDLQLVVRHVRGHQGAAAVATSGRAWVNNEVDRIAKAGMTAARAALTTNPNSAPSGATTPSQEGAVA